MLNTKHAKTLSLIFADPVHSNVKWRDIEGLLVALGASVSEGRGSRVSVKLGQERAVFHRPHPEPDTDKGALKAVRRFLESAGVVP